MIMIMDTDMVMVMVMVDRYLLYRLAIIGQLLRQKHERSTAPGLNLGLNLPRIHIRKYELRRRISINTIKRRRYQTTHRSMENKDQIGETTSNNLNGWIR
jgi:predicted thioesterase